MSSVSDKQWWGDGKSVPVWEREDVSSMAFWRRKLCGSQRVVNKSCYDLAP